MTSKKISTRRMWQNIIGLVDNTALARFLMLIAATPMVRSNSQHDLKAVAKTPSKSTLINNSKSKTPSIPTPKWLWTKVGANKNTTKRRKRASLRLSVQKSVMIQATVHSRTAHKSKFNLWRFKPNTNMPQACK